MLNYCDGEAKAIIVHCAFLEPEEGYGKVLDLLEESFGQKNITTHEFIDMMLKISSIKGTTPYNFRRLSREIQIFELTLKQTSDVSDLYFTKTVVNNRVSRTFPL